MCKTKYFVTGMKACTVVTTLLNKREKLHVHVQATNVLGLKIEFTTPTLVSL